MRIRPTFLVSLATAALLPSLCTAVTASDNPLAWPAITRLHRPWAYHWWLGSAVDRPNLAKELERYREGGLGGIHIIPIYGANSARSRWTDYLGADWLDRFAAASSEAEARDLGVDLTLGTGWCYGGPWVRPELGGQGLTTLASPFPGEGRVPAKSLRAGLRWLHLEATGPDGTRVDLRSRVSPDGVLGWHPDGPTDGWRLTGVGTWPTLRKVKRAAPGGEGNMINPFHAEAMTNYLAVFDQAFDRFRRLRPRAIYHDSFEYYDAAWAPDVAEEFARRRGYALEDHWQALAGSGDPDRVRRVWHDYRETVADMMVDKVFGPWAAWARERGVLTRNQAHGSPGNWLDLYALADIPETEMFGSGAKAGLTSGFDANIGGGDRDPVVSKFASSAAHVAGKPLVAAETGTWMAEHFRGTFEELKCVVDRMFVSGVNHVFYHGCVYSPDDVAWPGWLFYASTQMNPRNPLWREASAINAYVARAQSILQSGHPDNSVLLYWNVSETWMNPEPGVKNMSVHSRAWVPPISRRLFEKGFAYDQVSDRQLRTLSVTADGAIAAPGGTYRTLLIPAGNTLPLEALEHAFRLAQSGATIGLESPVADDVPGLARLEERRARLHALKQRLGHGDEVSVRTIACGKGFLLVGPGEAILAAAGAGPEPLAAHPGAMFARRRHDTGHHYFIANQGLEPMQGWYELAKPAATAGLLNPLSGAAYAAQTRAGQKGALEVFLDLAPGHSIILRTFDRPTTLGQPPARHHPKDITARLDGPWHVQFIAGGPVLPRPWDTTNLVSWTENGDPETQRFSGTAEYRTEFDYPGDLGETLFLDLGDVRDVARIRLNGRDLGTLLMRPFTLELPPGLLQAKSNRLQVEVTNLGANRLRDLDRRQVPWRDFFFVNIAYQPFNASEWPVTLSGLLSPVTLRR